MRHLLLCVSCFMRIFIIHTHPISKNIDKENETSNPNLFNTWKNILRIPCNGDINAMCDVIDVAAPYSQAIASETIKNMVKSTPNDTRNAVENEQEIPVSDVSNGFVDVVANVLEHSQKEEPIPLEESKIDTVDGGTIRYTGENKLIDNIKPSPVNHTEIQKHIMKEDVQTFVQEKQSHVTEGVNTDVTRINTKNHVEKESTAENIKSVIKDYQNVIEDLIADTSESKHHHPSYNIAGSSIVKNPLQQVSDPNKYYQTVIEDSINPNEENTALTEVVNCINKAEPIETDDVSLVTEKHNFVCDISPQETRETMQTSESKGSSIVKKPLQQVSTDPGIEDNVEDTKVSDEETIEKVPAPEVVITDGADNVDSSLK